MLGSRVYVGTWGKYNDGNLDGAWVELSDFDSYEDFLDYAAELHKDEYSPEFMYQDWESVPNGWISNYNLDERIFNLSMFVIECGISFNLFVSRFNSSNEYNLPRLSGIS